MTSNHKLKHENRISTLQCNESEAKSQATLAHWACVLANCCGAGAAFTSIAHLANKHFDDCADLACCAIMLFIIGHMAYNTHTDKLKQAKKIHKQILKAQKQHTK